MKTPLHYLGAFETVQQVEDAYHTARGSSDTYYAFGWAWLTFGKQGTVGNLVRAMVGWIPGDCGHTEGGVWPVYIDESNPPDTAPMSNWLWDGHLSRPTLKPSILKRIEPTISSPAKQLAHGYVRDGEWQPC